MMSYAFNFQGNSYDSLRHFQKHYRKLSYDQLKALKHLAESKEHFIELLECAVRQVESGSTRINFEDLVNFPKVQLSFSDLSEKEETIVSIEDGESEDAKEKSEDLTEDELYNSFSAEDLDQRKVVVRRNGTEVEVPFKSNEIDSLVRFIKQL